MPNKLLLALLLVGILALAVGGFTVRGLRRAARALLRPAAPRVRAPGSPAYG